MPSSRWGWVAWGRGAGVAWRAGAGSAGGPGAAVGLGAVRRGPRGWRVEVVVVETAWSWTNTSYAPFASPATRLVALLWNATKPPSAERAGPALASFPWVPSEAPLTRSVVPVCRSWTNTSVAPFVSPATRLVAALWNATKRPSAERAG